MGAMSEIDSAQIAFRPLRREDLPLLQRWLSLPHVDAFFRQALDAAGVEAKFVPRIEGREPTYVFILELDARPIGWLQWYRWADYPRHAAMLGADPTTAGVDFAIGERDALGRGIGARALRAFVERVVFADSAITACVSDPEAANTRSLRTFARAGFSVVRTVQLLGDPNPRQIVRCERPSPAISKP